MTYEQALEYLASLNKFGMNFGLARIEKLVELMGHPECRYKTIHITGTNGKGSTSAMLAAILAASGLKCGLYTSPHLSEYTERMTINGQEISRENFAGAIEYTAKFVEQVVAGGFEHPTEFEVLTAAAFYHFARSGVEYAVIEVGLGGLLDSTNVILPEVAVITNVSLEHTDRCGNTVAEIARHKAGIIKKGAPVVTAAKNEALDVIKAEASAKGAPLYIMGVDFSAEVAGLEGYKQIVSIMTGDGAVHGPFRLNLAGRHQTENCALAVAVAFILSSSQPKITSDAIFRALDEVKWPGRFEIFDRQPPVVLDGAHNPAGAQVLRDALDEVFPAQKTTFLLGILADKDIGAITGKLVRPHDEAVLVRPDSTRAADPSAIAGYLSAGKIELADSIAEGYRKACSMAGPAGLVCVAGSLYLIGPARDLIMDK